LYIMVMVSFGDVSIQQSFSANYTDDLFLLIPESRKCLHLK
jgi:hypothetical protein